MNKRQIRKQLKGYKRDEEIFVMTYDRADGDKLLDFLDEDNEKIPPLTDAEWLEVTRKMNVDDAVWQEAYNAFHYYIESILEERRKNADSK